MIDANHMNLLVLLEYCGKKRLGEPYHVGLIFSRVFIKVAVLALDIVPEIIQLGY